MKITLLTLFPGFVETYFETSIVGRAVKEGLIEVSVVDVRDFATDTHRTVDDAPYGGGAGMVLMAGPLGRAIEAHRTTTSRCVYATPSGIPFSQEHARRLASCDEVLLVCGRYEGVDERIIERYIDEEVSIGDYVLSSGELAALVIVDACARLIDGVITRESLEEESFQDGLLEYPLYTRPEIWDGESVPPVLLSGHHAEIARWRRRKQLEKTARNRPDLLASAELTAEERATFCAPRERSNDGRDQSG
jgi:tRNA (guanine37-N1)-methyltransferase